MAKQKQLTLLDLIWKGKFLIGIYLLSILILPFLIENAQQYYYCNNEFSCSIAGSYNWFLLSTLILSPFIIGYIYALITKKKITRFLSFTCITFCFFYIFATYLAWNTYLKISENNIEIQDMIYSQTSKQLNITDIKQLQITKSFSALRYRINKCSTNTKIILENGEVVDITNFGFGYSEVLSAIRQYKNIPIEYETNSPQACPVSNTE